MNDKPIRIGNTSKSKGQGNRVYSVDGKSVCISANGGGGGAKTGLYAIPINTTEDKARTVMAGYYKYGKATILTNKGFKGGATAVAMKYDKGYEVKGGFINIDGENYPIKLPDGKYIIRKLTPIECERLQTLPDNYTEGVSNTQRYKQIGNGWTVDVICHILKNMRTDNEFKNN